jgi:hypothetical protein
MTRDYNGTVPLQAVMSIAYGVRRLINGGRHPLREAHASRTLPPGTTAHPCLYTANRHRGAESARFARRAGSGACRSAPAAFQALLALRPCSRREPAGSVLLCAGCTPKFATIVIAVISKSPREPHRRPAPGSPWSRPGRIMRSIPVVHGAIVAQPRAVQDDGRRRGLVFTGSL